MYILVVHIQNTIYLFVKKNCEEDIYLFLFYFFLTHLLLIICFLFSLSSFVFLFYAYIYIGEQYEYNKKKLRTIFNVSKYLNTTKLLCIKIYKVILAGAVNGPYVCSALCYVVMQ